MIVNHVSRVLDEQRMTIAELQRRTGLTYANLHALAHGKAQRLDLGTLDRLCAALGVGVGDLFEHVPEAQP
jgi:putative transcriptional regulator